MRSTINLHILQREFTQLFESSYFDRGFKEFNQNTLNAIEHVLSNIGIYPPTVLKAFEAHLWNARTFVKGSKVSDTPYEVQYALKIAMRQWMPESILISSAELENVNFFLNTLDLWTFIQKSLIHYDSQGYQPIVARIGSPSFYKHRPIFCIPLFHELGHFLDLRFKISEISMLRNHPNGVDPSDGASLQKAHRHRMEHFADLFAACYCSNSLNDILVHIGGMQPATATHPGTANRVAVVNDFLAGAPNSEIDILQDALTARSMPQLSVQYDIPQVAPAFNDVLVYRVRSDAQLFGLFPAAWSYLEAQLDSRSAPWITADLTDLNIETTINDLVQKSLRNYEIVKRWADVIVV